MKRKSIKLVGAAMFGMAILAGVLLMLRVARAAPATTISVTTFNDEAADNGLCSLREAITAANTDAAFNGCPAGSGLDTIVLAAGAYPLTITGTNENHNANGNLDILSPLIISGAGVANTFIEGGPTFNEGIFFVNANPVQIVGVTIRRGTGMGGVWNYADGGLTISGSLIISNTSTSFGGGIYNQGALTLVNSTVKGNTCANGAGGIESTGPLTVTNSTIANNTSATDAGGIYSQDRLTVLSSTVSGNTGLYGGGLLISGGLTNLVQNTTISANHAISGAGGLGLQGARATISDSLIISNSAPLAGGIGNMGVMVIEASDILSNTADRGAGIGNGLLLQVHGSHIAYNVAADIGGGIGNDGGTNFGIGQATIVDTVIEHNQAGRGGGIGQAGVLTLTNSVLQKNTATVRGGGISIGNGLTVLSNSQILSNVAPSGGGIFNTSETQYGQLLPSVSTFSKLTIRDNSNGGLVFVTGTATILSSTLTGNAPNCSVSGGAFTSQGGNTSGDASCLALFIGPGDQNGAGYKLYLPLLRK